jgi:hypothetical protein
MQWSAIATIKGIHGIGKSDRLLLVALVFYG